MSTTLNEQINDVILEYEYEVIQSMLSLENKQETMAIYSESFVQEADNENQPKKPGIIKRLIEWIKKAIKSLVNKIKSFVGGKKKQPEVSIVVPKNVEDKQKELKNDIDKIDNETKKANSLVKKILIGLGITAGVGTRAALTAHNIKKTKENIDNIKKAKSGDKKLDEEAHKKANIECEFMLRQLKTQLDTIANDINKIKSKVNFDIAFFSIPHTLGYYTDAENIINDLSKYIDTLNELHTSLDKIDVLDIYRTTHSYPSSDSDTSKVHKDCVLLKKKVEEMIQQYGDIIKNINNVYANYDQLYELKEKIQKSPESYEGTDRKFDNLYVEVSYDRYNDNIRQAFTVHSSKWMVVYKYKCKLSSSLIKDVIEKYNLSTTSSEIMLMIKKDKPKDGEPLAIFINITQYDASYSDIYVPIVTKDVLYDLIARMIKDKLERGGKAEYYHANEYHCKAVKFVPDKSVNIKGLANYDKE